MTEEQESTKQPRDIQHLLFERAERLKELAAINQTTDILKEGKPLDDTLQQLAQLFPLAWQYPEYTVCCISFAGKEYKSPGFTRSSWLQRHADYFVCAPINLFGNTHWTGDPLRIRS